jgi:hypothetical protein
VTKLPESSGDESSYTVEMAGLRGKSKGGRWSAGRTGADMGVLGVGVRSELVPEACDGDLLSGLRKKAEYVEPAFQFSTTGKIRFMKRTYQARLASWVP